MTKQKKKGRGGRRAGSGRRSRYPGPYAILSLSCPEPLAAEVDRWAAEQGLSRSQAICDLILRGLPKSRRPTFRSS